MTLPTRLRRGGSFLTKIGRGGVPVNIASINARARFIDYHPNCALLYSEPMNKRALAIRRRMIRAISMGLLLGALLSIEGLAMTQVWRGFSHAPSAQQQVPVDPRGFIQSW